MIITATGPARISHGSTGVSYEIETDELDWSATGGSERQMGPEAEYQAIIEHPELGMLSWSVWEYPAGALNYVTYDVGPHQLVSDFEISLEHEPDLEPEDYPETVSDDVWFRDEEGNAISQTMLESMNADSQKQVLKRWFLSMFEDPQNETPYAPKDSVSDSNYSYLWGGPYDAGEQLFDKFSGAVPEEVINDVAEELQGDTGIYEWAPGPNHPDQIRASEEYQAEQEPDPFCLLTPIKARLERDEIATFSNAGAVQEMGELKASIKELRSAIVGLNGLSGQQPGIGHNRPPSDLDVSYEVQKEIEEQLDTVEAELETDEPDPKTVLNAGEVVKRFWDQFASVVKSTWTKTKGKMAESLSHQITTNGPIWLAVFWEKLYAFGIQVTEWLAAGLSLL